ncbi:flavin-dependent dehydrogenase [Pannus brasiliensis CCIBt3594]|uniref:Flavin-dependent dehydrogenase n=1 Tax=Pannus brasiliensis CCIBt3594 TaxID=1427578 RepID=A0AAW9QRC8_9CHRO
MREILYREVPTPDTDTVRRWLQENWEPPVGEKIPSSSGVRVKLPEGEATELSIFVWNLQGTTYLKVFRWGQRPHPQEDRIARHLDRDIREDFPPRYPTIPEIDFSATSIFEALEPYYPKTVHFFRKMPKGELDLQRLYWWEKRWRESARNPLQPKSVLFPNSSAGENPEYDLIYIGGALGAIHAASMALLGYRVLLVERLPFGRMNREWNISRSEFQHAIDLGLFTAEEFEGLIFKEYIDGYSKFYDGSIPDSLKAEILHTPTVLNIAINSDKLLQSCGEKIKARGGEILDETEFDRADIDANGVTVTVKHLPSGEIRQVRGRLLIDAMGTASPIAWQLNGARAFDSVCPTVGAVVEGFDRAVWDNHYGDVLNSHGDISKGRQLIWELFPGEGDELTFYLFHYHQVHPENPGSLLEMYEDFFTILPEYRRCDMEELIWKKPTFGYIPGHFSTGKRDRVVAFDRVLSIGDAASLQSPLIFTGFGFLVRNLKRLTELVDTALKHDLLTAEDLASVRAYQSNVAVTWLFSKGMMVPTGRTLPPERINAMLNTFFGLLADEPPEVADTFIKDRTDWMTFSRLAIKAARKNPALLFWIWEMAGSRDLIRWLGSYADFSLDAVKNLLLSSWFPRWLKESRSWLERDYPRLWLKLLSFQYSLRG